MSGTFCGGCGEGNLVRDPAGVGKEPVVCDLCAWTADGAELSRQWMEDDDVPWTKRERKAAGRLFFLWLDIDPRHEDEAVSAILRVLKLDGMCVAPRVLLELETPPPLEKLRAIPGVSGVRLAP